MFEIIVDKEQVFVYNFHIKNICSMRGGFMKQKYVLKNKKKFLAFIILSLVSLFSAFYSNAAYGYRDTAYETVNVRQGDTLWSIANQYNKNEDIRKYIYEVKKINNLTSNVIYAGTQLKLPSE